ncbi:hypothetical protein MMC11_008712 [Xylographa trunciseda]|nr:hypothetical protein [Xylographa trunciseda]
MDPLNVVVALTSVAVSVLGALNDDIDERIQLDDALIAHIEKYGTVDPQDGTGRRTLKPTISALDVDRLGNHIYRGAAAAQHASTFRANLPDIGLEATRIIFLDVPTSKEHRPITQVTAPSERVLPGNVERLRLLVRNRGRAGTTLLGNLTYDGGELAPESTFRDVQERMFNVWDLHNIWRTSSTGPGCPFYVQANVLESLLETSTTFEESPYLSRQVLLFGQYAIEFWESLSSVQTEFLSNGRAEITCKFSTLPMKFRLGRETQKCIEFSPLKYHFQRLLERDSAATAIGQNSRAFACQMVALDLLRAAVEYWIVFLSQAIRRSEVHASNLDNRSRSYNILTFKSLSKLTRNLDLAIQYTLQVAFASLDDKDIEVKPKLRAIELEINAKTGSLKNKIDDFLASLEAISEVKRTLIEEDQALSVTRLTILAAIFLPLSLSSSLLSMNNRAADLGLLWYDYVGVCTMLIFCVFVVYQFMRTKDVLRVTQATATAKTLDKLKKKSPFIWRLSRKLVKWVSTSMYSSDIAYNITQESYWSLQEASLSPACILVPETSRDVAKAVSIISGIEDCHFAIKGQSHAPAAGFANINAGVTIDMTSLKSVTVNHERTVAGVGAGASWSDVYLYLDALSLSVAGGRNGAVGVGGLTLGGGISYFSPRVGWACDNVVNFEIVLASGKLTNANASSLPDHFRALKGGWNNFGILTRFDMAAFPQGDILGGNIVQDISYRNEVFKAFANIAGAPKYDIYASLVMGLIFNATSKAWSLGTTAIYTKPVSKPPVFDELLSIPTITNTQHITNLSMLAAEASTLPLNWAFLTGTYGVSAPLLSVIFDSLNATMYDFNIPNGILWSVAFEPLPTVIVEYGDLKGGNSLGTSPKDGNAIILLLAGIWTNAASDDLVEHMAQRMMKDVADIAQQMGLLHRFQYINYADPSQNPVWSYGQNNVERLRAASRKYDPEGVFQTQVPGGFKLGH